jgi:hypothetical protein
VFALLLAIGAAFAAFVQSRGYTLYYGDAEAHLNIARRIVDSRTPGYDQIGTVWLPLPHVLMLPLIGDDHMWRTGLAGAIPGVLCFALAGMALFAATRLIFESTAAGVCAALLLALNPNVLYLQSIPMTEAVMLASFCGLLYFCARFSAKPSMWAIAGAALCSLAASATRYEGWFVIPFVCLFLLFKGGSRAALVFGAVASIFPLAWFAHNWYFEGDALAFYRGPYSALAINKGSEYPGRHDWSKAILYYRTAVELCGGTVLVWLGAAGVLAVLWRRAWWALLFLALPVMFYVLSMYSSGTPIFVPVLWPNTYYNTRYGIAAIPLLAFAAAALAAVAPARFRAAAAGVVVIGAVLPWVAYPRPDNWICWKESKVNSDARRAWTEATGAFLAEHYRGGGIFFSFGDMTGALRQAGIPLRGGLHEGNGLLFPAAVQRPDLFLWEDWAVTMPSQSVGQSMLNLVKAGRPYRLVHTIEVKGAEPIQIYRRVHDHPVHEGPRSAQ